MAIVRMEDDVIYRMVPFTMTLSGGSDSNNFNDTEQCAIDPRAAADSRIRH